MILSDSPEVMMNVPAERASGSLADEIHMALLRQMIEGMAEVNRQLHTMNVNQLQVVQRLTILEQNPVAALEARLIILEAEALRNQGAKNLMAWFRDYTPWLLGIIAAIVLYITKKPGG